MRERPRAAVVDMGAEQGEIVMTMRTLFIALFTLIASSVSAQHRYIGLDAIALEQNVTNGFKTVDAVTGSPYDWSKATTGYQQLMDTVVTGYRKRYGTSSPVTDTEIHTAVLFFQKYLFEEKQIGYRDLESMVAQTITEHRVDCDMACLYLIDFLHTLGVPLSQMGMLHIVNPEWLETHDIVRARTQYYESLPVLLPNGAFEYDSYSREETFEQYPTSDLLSAEDTMVTHNGLGILEVLSAMASQYDPCNNGPGNATGTFKQYPDERRFIRLANRVLDVALPFASRFLDHNPLCFGAMNDDVVLHMIASRTAMLVGDTGMATKLFMSALNETMMCIRLVPSSFLPHANLSLAYEGIVVHRPDLALEHARIALTLLPSDAERQRETLSNRVTQLEHEVATKH